MSFRSLLDEFSTASASWNNAQSWLNKVKSFIIKDPSSVASEKFTLAKRLAQCLNPELVHHLHLTSLEVYEIIFESTEIIEDFALFSGGILPFFEAAHRDCQIMVMRIIEKSVVSKAEQLTFAFPGIVCSLLPGFKINSEDQEINDKIIRIFDGIAMKDQQSLFGAVWQGLLRSPKIRLQALYYLSNRLPKPPNKLKGFLPQKNLLINSLTASMNYQNPEVQKATLELLIIYFPIDVSTEILDDSEKISLIQQGLKLLNTMHEDLVWTWMFPEGVFDQNILIKQRAFENLFEVNSAKVEENILPLEIIEKVTLKIEDNLEFLKPIVVPLLKYANRLNDTPSGIGIISKIQSILKEKTEFEGLIWSALLDSLNEELQDDKHSTIEVLKFFLSTFRSTHEERNIIPLLNSLLSGIRGLSNSLGSALELIQMMMNRLPSSAPSLSNSIKNFHLYFSSISSDPSKGPYLKISASILLSLEKHTNDDNEKEWIKCLVDAMHSITTDVALTGIENIIGLLEDKASIYKHLLERYNEADIIIDVFERLWKVIAETGSRKKAVELILRVEKFDHEFFIELIQKKLIGDDNAHRTSIHSGRESLDAGQNQQLKEIKSAIRTFTEFWKCTGKYFSEILREKFKERQVVFTILDYLEYASPEIRQLAREWVVESIDNFECVLDPVINILLDIQVEKQGDSYILSRFYDTGIILDAFKKLKKLIRNGGEIVITKAGTLKVPEYMNMFLSRNFCEKAENYVEVMLEIAILYIRTETEDASLLKENHIVQAAAAEYLDLELSQGSLMLAQKAVNRVLQSLCRSIEKEDGVMQLLLLKILRVVFFEYKVSPDDENFRKIVSSKLFSEVYLGVIKTKDNYILSHWVNFIVESLSMVMHFLDHADRLRYYLELIANFCNEIMNTADTATLFIGLKVVLHKALEIGDEGSNLVPEVNFYSEKKSSGFWTSLKMFTGGVPQDVKEKDLKPEVLKQLERVIITCLSCIPNCALSVEVSWLGISAFTSATSVKIQHPSLEILNPILQKYPNEFIFSITSIWRSRGTNIDISTNRFIRQNSIKSPDEGLQKIISTLISMTFSLKAFVQALNSHLDKFKITDKKQSGEFDIIGFCHLCTSVFSCITDESLRAIDDKKAFWGDICSLLIKLESTGNTYCHLWLMDLLYLLLSRVSIDEEIRDNAFKKSIQTLAENLIKSISNLSFQQALNDISPPYAPSIFKQACKSQMNLNLAALHVLKTNLYKIVTILFQADNKEKGFFLMKAPINDSLNLFWGKSSYFDVALMSELLCSLVCSPDTKPDDRFKRSVIDNLVETDLFDNMKNSRECFKNWCKIISSVSVLYYPDKSILISEFFNKEPSMFANERERRSYKGRKLKAIAFVIYSGEKDLYQSTSETLCKNLIEFIKQDRALDPFIFFTVRVMLLKLSHTALSNIWPQLWPHLLTELMQILQPDEGLTLRFAALKFLDLISAINSEEFLMYQWLFFYDHMVSDQFSNVDEFPIVNRLVNGEMLLEEIENTTKQVERKLIMKDMPTTEEKLREKIKELCREVVRTNTLRSVPNEDDIAEVIEEDFFALKIN